MKVLLLILINEIRKIITLVSFFKSVIPKEQNATSYMFENTTILIFCLFWTKHSPSSPWTTPVDCPNGLPKNGPRY